MKAIKKMVMAVLVLTGPVLLSQNKKDSLGLPGDNFDLYGALELFKKSENPEAFEKAINAKDNEVNNLDLDADGKVDYIKVIDKTQGDAHSLVMQVSVSKTESQDVAVIEIEKSGNDKAKMQIVGDEELYGKDYIVEPKETPVASSDRSATATNNGVVDDVYENGSNVTDNSSNSNNDNNNYSNSGNQPVVVNVYAWPAVQYVYTPAYVGWSSPWYWGYYPGWWQPWPPIYYGVYYRRMYHYHQPYYHRAYQYRCQNAHNYYYGHRNASETVRAHNRSGHYRDKQASYRNNAVPGRRYNNQPANPRQNGMREQSGNVRNGNQNPRLGRQEGNQEQAGPKRARPQQALPGAGTQPRQKARAQDIAPGRSGAQPKQQARPQQVLPGSPKAQPRQQTGPQKASPGGTQPKPIIQPGGRRQAMPAERNSGGSGRGR